MESNPIPSFVVSNHNQGRNELQMPSWDVSMQVYTSGNLFGDASSTDTTLFDSDNQHGGAGVFALPARFSPFKHQPGYEMGNSSFDELLQDSALLNPKLPLPRFDSEFANMEKTRRLPHRINYNDLLSPKQGMLLRESTSTNGLKRKRSDSSSSFSHKKPQHSKIHSEKKSPRLSEKITFLQKLVSPYGKTDTASVLQETSLYIKVLQEQIRELFHFFLRSYDAARATNLQGIQAERQNLRSKGLCLVPSSFSQNLAKKS